MANGSDFVIWYTDACRHVIYSWFSILTEYCSRKEHYHILDGGPETSWEKRQRCTMHTAHVSNLWLIFCHLNETESSLYMSPWDTLSTLTCLLSSPYFPCSYFKSTFGRQSVADSNLVVRIRHHDHSPWSFAIKLTEIITCVEVMDCSPNSLPTSDHTVALRHASSPSWFPVCQKRRN